MQKRFIVGIMTLCMGLLICFSAVAATNITDISGHWAEIHIEKWINDGFITGYPDGQFKPDNSITRAELVTLVNQAFEIPNNDSTSSFSDVKPSDWFYDDVMSGQAAGYISGYPDGTFRPNNPITRQEAASLITKLLDLEPGNAIVLDSFSDQYRIDEWAKSGVNGVITHGIMGGFPDKTFGPRKNITRAETIVTLDKALVYEPEKISGINGIVKRDNKPAKGATIRVFHKGSHESLQDTITGQDGAFTFTVPDGQYEITAVQDRNVGYIGPITVTSGSAAGTQEVSLATGTRVSGKLVDKSGKALANTPFYFTTNPSFGGRTNNNGEFSQVLPMQGPDGQLLPYTGFFFHNGIRHDFITGKQFSGDTNLGQVNTNVPGQTTAGGGGGGGGGGGLPTDTNPPAWVQGYPQTADTTATGFKLLSKTNESGSAYYVVLADGATAPTAIEVKTGSGSGGSAAIQNGTQALQANTEASFTITGLTASTSYDIYVVAEDGTGNLQASTVKLDITTAGAPDTTPPSWVDTYPQTADTTATGFKLLSKTNESGNAYYVVLADGATAPTAIEVKTGSGSGGSAAIQNGTQALQADTEASFTITGLTASTSYDIYVVAEDGAGNLQASTVKLDVTTAAAPGDTAPPLWETDYPQSTDVTNDGLTLRFKSNENGKAYYVVLDDGAAEPSTLEVKNGTGSGGSQAKANGQQDLQANTEAIANITGLTADTAYDIYVVAEDAVPNLQTNPVKLDVTIAPPDPGDNTPPSWTATYPKTAAITQSGFALLLNADENGTAYYVVLADNASSPTATEVKNGTGSGGSAVIQNGTQTLQANTEASITITGLTASTSYDIYVVAEDGAGNLQTSTVELDVTTAAAPDTTQPTVSSAAVNGTSLVLTFNEKLDPLSQPAGSDFSIKVNGNEQTAPTNVSIAGTQVTITLVQAVEHGDTVIVSYTPGINSILDEAGNATPGFADQSVTNNTGLLTAPTIDCTVATSLFDSTAFLYTGESAVQTAMDPDTIVKERAAVIRGQVFTRDNTPLPDVRISVWNHPQFGSTMSRSDGYFDMAINGGGLLTVSYVKDGYIPAQRQVNVPWQDFALLPDVVLINYDSTATEVTLGSSTMQVARGSKVNDEDGPRQATLIIPAGVTAQLADGTPMGKLTVRATEYTVGENGPQAMPAILPPNVGYTYCVEYNADEAGSQGVNFDRPVLHYVENIIGAPVGGIVPMGYYDYDQAAWIPSQNGRVIKILSITGGLADLDLDGSGAAADAAALDALSVTPDEQQRLAAMYGAGQELWRVPITHFSPWDCNWPYGPPIDADEPKLPKPKINKKEDDPCTGSGSIIEYQNQVLGESAPVFGTPFTLNYRSDRVEGNADTRTFAIPISQSEIHPDLKRIELEIKVAGQSFTKTFPAEPNQYFNYTFDGKDVYGRPVQGSTAVNVRIGYVYPAIYLNPAPLDNSFSQYGYRNPTGWSSNTARQEATVWQEWQDTISNWENLPAAGLGGWTLDVNHFYDPVKQVIFYGDGGRSRRGLSGAGGIVITTMAGGETGGYSGDGGPATQAQLVGPSKVAAGPDGSIYISEAGNQCIRRVSPEGIITTVAGTGTGGYSGDGGPATQAQLDYPNDVAVGSDGSLYISDTGNYCIRRVSPEGIITTVAGTGTGGYSGDGGLATQAQLSGLTGVAVGPDGSLYLAECEYTSEGLYGKYVNNRVRRVGKDGIITTVAGVGPGGYDGDGGPATQAHLNRPEGVAVGSDGTVYIAEMENQRIRRVGKDGIITTVAGIPWNRTGYFYSGDGGPATKARFHNIADVEVGPDGSLYITDCGNHSIRRVGPDGIISTVAGINLTEMGIYGDYSGDNGPATQARLNRPYGAAVGPDGFLYIADTGNGRIRRVGYMITGVHHTDIVVPAKDGSEFFVFDSAGRHKITLNGITGSEIYTFNYDNMGLLSQIKDAFNNITRIERDEQGNPTAIIAPGGQRTGLAVDEQGYLSKIICPLMKKKTLTYTSDGLLTSYSDHKENLHTFNYDELGRLIKDADPAGGYTELFREELPNGHEVSVRTAEGSVSKYRMEYLGTGGVRRVNTDPLGGVTTTEILPDGTPVVTHPDGYGDDLGPGARPPTGNRHGGAPGQGVYYRYTDGTTVNSYPGADGGNARPI